MWDSLRWSFIQQKAVGLIPTSWRCTGSELVLEWNFEQNPHPRPRAPLQTQQDPQQAGLEQTLSTPLVSFVFCTTGFWCPDAPIRREQLHLVPIR